MNARGLGRTYVDREIIVRQGESGECMFAIQSGRLEVVRESGDVEIPLGILQEGDIFGEMAIFEKQARSATVRAIGDVRVLTIDKKTFLRRIQEDPSLVLNVARSLCARIRRLNTELAELKLGRVKRGLA